MCNFKMIAEFVENDLDLNDKLDLLLHIDDCMLCFNEVYRLRKAQDERFFRYQVADSDHKTSESKRKSRKSRKRAAESTVENVESPIGSTEELAIIYG